MLPAAVLAEVCLDGGYLEVTIDHAGPTPMGPRPDLRRMLMPIGPVAVVGAGNFPLAFSVVGGDTASALAAGCAVVAKAHHPHPATSVLCLSRSAHLVPAFRGDWRVHGPSDWVLRSGMAQALLRPICQLYDEVFSRPPFHWRDDEPELHRQRLESLLAMPSYGIAVAYLGAELVGFAYGYTLPADTKRWSRLAEPLPPEVTAEWPGRTFHLFDLAVSAGYRDQGVGRALHNRLLGSRTEERATLAVQPTAIDTKRIYEHWGWYQVGQSISGPTAAAPLFDVYLRDQLDDLR